MNKNPMMMMKLVSNKIIWLLNRYNNKINKIQNLLRYIEIKLMILINQYIPLK